MKSSRSLSCVGTVRGKPSQLSALAEKIHVCDEICSTPSQLFFNDAFNSASDIFYKLIDFRQIENDHIIEAVVEMADDDFLSGNADLFQVKERIERDNQTKY